MALLSSGIKHTTQVERRLQRRTQNGQKDIKAKGTIHLPNTGAYTSQTYTTIVNSIKYKIKQNTTKHEKQGSI
jgi:hypothetical protein